MHLQAIAPRLRSAVPPLLTVPRLSIVIVNYRQWERTWQLVQQLRSSPLTVAGHAEIVIVDNNSPTHPLLSRLRRLDGVSVRRWGRNRGFARAVNEGVRLSRGEWVLLLNPDVTVPVGFVEEALNRTEDLQREASVGIVGFGLRDSDGSRQGSTGPFPTLWRTLTGLLWPRARRKYHRHPAETRCAVEWVTGCCLLARRSCLTDVGGLDTDFFLYYEDVDLCRRAQAKGWQILYDPSLEITHHLPLHRRPLTPLLRMVTRHALLKYAGKHWPGWQRRFLGHGIALEATLRRWWTVLRNKDMQGEQFDELRAMALAAAKGNEAEITTVLHRVLRQHETPRRARVQRQRLNSGRVSSGG